MKKNSIVSSGFIVVLFILFTACDKTKSYAEMKQDERNAISRFLQENELIIVSELPDKTPFDDRVYYKTPEGLYLRIESKGTPVDFSAAPDDVFIDFDGVTYFQTSSEEYQSNRSRQWLFQYNTPSSYYGSTLICDGFIIPLQEQYGLGDESIVSLIIPSEIGTMDQQSYVYPIFYRNVHYTVQAIKRPRSVD